jgi:hypothetical protein
MCSYLTITYVQHRLVESPLTGSAKTGRQGFESRVGYMCYVMQYALLMVGGPLSEPYDQPFSTQHQTKTPELIKAKFVSRNY